jgi:hypothetical protein
MERQATRTPVVFLGDQEDFLHAGHMTHVRVVDLLGVKFLHLLLGDKPALVTVSLFRQVLTASVADPFLIISDLLLLPVPEYFFEFAIAGPLDARGLAQLTVLLCLSREEHLRVLNSHVFLGVHLADCGAPGP